jgi:hypothetical protein
MNAISRRGFIIAGGLASGGAALWGATTPAQAATGSVSLRILSAGFIFGGTGGEGVLSFHGRRYPLTVGGVSVGATFGASGADLYGTASHMRRPDDIAGVYSKLNAGVAAGTGEEYSELVNQNGVVLRLRGRETGLMVSLDLSGMALSIKG